MTQRSWYRIENTANDPTAVDIFVFDEIGASFFNERAVTAAQFVADLAALDASVKTLNIRVNSPGGDVFEATTIANALRAEREKGRNVVVTIEGLAASAATIITSAGSPIRIADNGMMMIHDPIALTFGDAGDHRDMAGALDKIRDSIIVAYRWTSKQSEDELRTAMARESWYSADEAIAAGLATEKVEGIAAAAAFDPRVLAKLHVPDRFRPHIAAMARTDPPAPARPRAADAAEVLTHVVKGGLTTEFARELITAKLPMDQVTARIADARDIAAVCNVAGLGHLADRFISSGMPLALARPLLCDLKALLSGDEIDNKIPSRDQVAATSASWAKAFDKIHGKFTGKTRPPTFEQQRSAGGQR